MARTAERNLSVVLDPHDDLATLNRLRRLHARPFGQVVCEPAPTGGSSGLARSVLAALGKDPDLGPRRDPLWRLVDVHLRAERTRELIVLRAHTLTYAALRRLADITDAAEIHLSLVVHTERLPGPVAQLVEGLPHDARELDRLLEQTPDPAGEQDEVDELPAGAGLEFPYVHAISGHDGRPRSAIARTLPRAQRVEVVELWDQAHAWTTRWLDEHPDAPYQQCADAIYLLARHGDSASESTPASALRSMPSLAPARTPTPAPSTRPCTGASARSGHASSTRHSPAPPRSPIRRPTRSAPR